MGRVGIKIFNCGIRWVLQGGRIKALPFPPGCLFPAWCRAAQVPTLLKEGPRREDGPRDTLLAMVHTVVAPAAVQAATPHLLLALRKEEWL